MTKRDDNKFKRRPGDAYATPARAVLPLLPHISRARNYIETCAGAGALVQHLAQHCKTCVLACDVTPTHSSVRERDALTLDDKDGAQAFITNPPWTRPIMHALIMHLSDIMPTWLLIEADLMCTKQAAPLLERCDMVVAIGRVRWMAGTKHDGFDNCAWYRFDRRHKDGPRFFGRSDD